MSETLNSIQELGRLGQSVWYDNMYRSLITSGELERLVEMGVTGLTSNPTIFQKAISSGSEYDDSLVKHASRGLNPEQLFEALATEDIRATADILRPVYERSGGSDGFASLEVSPRLAHDTDGTIEAALRLFGALHRPNVMIKVPATPEGIPAIRALIGKGVNVNVTLIFSLDMYTRVREAYVRGLEDLERAGGDLRAVSSVASFFVSRVDTAVDGLIEDRDGALETLMGKAAVANAKIAYQDFKKTFGMDRFGALARKGARVQKPLWASTSTKNPLYSDVMYVETLIGADTVNTMPDATLEAFLDHGRASDSIERDVEESRDVICQLEKAGISMDAVTTNLMHEGVKAFADSFELLLGDLEAKRERLMASAAAPVGAPADGS
ncbi:MAG: transaldolase [Dehalococcoidia bacterium]|nr:transaldolase [Dehalococcoidia bacterium]